MSGADLPPLKTRKLGRTNVRVTELGLGTAPLGELFDKIADDEAAAIIGAAWDGGVRYFDTSPWYGRGLAEHSLGRALYRKPRDQYVISTKIGRVLRRPLGPNAIKDQWLGGLEFQTVFDYGYDGVMRSFEDSLQRLGINRVDVLLIHDLDPWDHNPATLNAYLTQLKTSGWKALAELREAGVIGGIGAGFNSMGSIPRFLDLFDMDFFLLAMRYTLLEQDVLDSEFPRCEARGVGMRRLQFRNSRDRRGPRCDVQLRVRWPRDSGAGEENRGGLRAPSCSASRRGAAISPRPPHRGLDHSGRDFARAGRRERGRLPPSHPCRLMG
jgi:D-threo-aldose 1-dehydrogenase